MRRASFIMSLKKMYFRSFFLSSLILGFLPTQSTWAGIAGSGSSYTLDCSDGSVNTQNLVASSTITVTIQNCAYWLASGSGISPTGNSYNGGATTVYTVSANASGRVEGYNAGQSPAGADQSLYFLTPQTIAFVNPGAKTFGTSPTLTATASSGLTLSFTSSTTGVCSITSGGVLSFVTAGTCTINADQAGNSSYLAAPQVSRSFSVNYSQVITFANPGAQSFGTSPTLTATASSGLTPTFTSSTPGVCSITSGGALTLATVGTCTINADQAGNSSYLAATQLGRSFSVNYPTVGSGNNPGGSGTVVTAVSGVPVGCGFSTVQFNSAPSGAPAHLSFPYGLVNMTVGGSCGSGATATFALTYPANLPAHTQFWKYGKTAGNTLDHWYQLTMATNNVVISNNTITYTVADGGFGDDDYTVNGTIVDPGGPGVPVFDPARATGIPTLSEWSMLLLVSLLALVGLGHMRRRRGPMPK